MTRRSSTSPTPRRRPGSPTVDVPDARERAGDLRRRRRQGVPERRRGARPSWPGSPGPTARRSWPASGSCRRVVIEGAAGRPGRRRPRPGARTGPRRAGRAGASASLAALAALFALFLGAARSSRSSLRAILDGSLGRRGRLADRSSTRSWLSLVTTAISLVITVVARAAARLRPRPPPVPRQVARRGDRRPADRPAAVGRRARAAARLRAARAARRRRSSVLGISVPFTTVAVILAQTFVSAPFFIRSARTGIAGVDRDLEDAARVDGASERQLFRAVTVPARRRRPRRRAWS